MSVFPYQNFPCFLILIMTIYIYIYIYIYILTYFLPMVVNFILQMHIHIYFKSDEGKISIVFKVLEKFFGI